MNVLFWVLQVLLALHTVMGAVWKFSNSEQTVPSLAAIPHAVWMGLSGVELLCAAALLLPILKRNLGRWAPVAAAVIAFEMLAFCGVHLASGDPNSGPLIYWLVVAMFCAILAYGRWRMKPIA